MLGRIPNEEPLWIVHVRSFQALYPCRHETNSVRSVSDISHLSVMMHVLLLFLHCALAAAQCVVIRPVCLCVCLWVYYHYNSKLRASILTKMGFVGKGSHHLQMIKFWPSRVPGKGVCGRVKIFGSALLQLARSVCVSSEQCCHCVQRSGR